MLIGTGTLTATISWDIQAKEIAPTSSCPLSATINNQKDLDSLRSLRDIMTTSQTGLLITALYYQHAHEIAAILIQNPNLQEQIQELVSKNIGLVEQLFSEGRVALSDEVIKEVECFMKDLKTYASPHLQGSIELVLDKMADASFAKELVFDVYKKASKPEPR